LSFDPEASERRLRRTSWLLVALMSIAALAWGARIGLAVAAGGVLSTLNLEGLVRLVHLLTSSTPRKASWLAVLGVALRYLLLGVGLFVIVSVWRVNALALSLGLSAPAAAVFLELARDTMREFRSHSDIDT
jgi:hypothetical protein